MNEEIDEQVKKTQVPIENSIQGNKTDGNTPTVDILTDTVRKYPKLLKFVDPDFFLFDTLRNISDQYASIHTGEPPMETVEEFKAMLKVYRPYTGASSSGKRKESEEGDRRRKSSPTEIIENLNGEYFSTPQGQRFYCEPGSIPMDIESLEFEGLVSDYKYKAGDNLPSGEEIATIRRYARFLASKNVKEVGVRVAKTNDSFVYDPVRPDGQIYLISSDGVNLTSPDIPCTVRYPGMLEADVRDGTIVDYLSLIGMWNLTESGKILSMGLSFSWFIPDIPHAIEIVTGGHGAGKTSYTETMRELFDPNGAPTQSLKPDERDLSISALHQGMLAFDNVNGIMPDYISDFLCRLTTGQGFRARELYTNTGETILKLKKPIIINGINRPGYRPDFIDREVSIDLGVMPEGRRLTDAEIRIRAAQLIPRVRGFLLSLIPMAIKLYPQVESELRGKLSRMADFEIWAECGVRAMGFPPMSFVNAYNQAKYREVEDVARDTLLITAIQGLMAGRKLWEGTTSDLLSDLERFVTPAQLKSKGFPTDTRRLGRELRILEPTLNEIGIKIDELKDGKRTKRITKTESPPKDYESNVSDVRLQGELGKCDVSNLTLTTDINLSLLSNVRSNVSVPDPVKFGPGSETDITDIKTENFYTPNVRDGTDAPKHGEVNPGNPGELADPVKSDVGNHPEDSPIKIDPGEIGEVADPVKSDVQRNTPITPINSYMLEGDTTTLSDDQNPASKHSLEWYILDIIEQKAPSEKYHTLTPKAIMDLLGSRFPDADVSMIFRICERFRKEGRLVKSGPGYRVNLEYIEGGSLTEGLE